MEVDEIERQVSKFQRIGSNGDNSSNPHKIATLRGNLDLRNQEHRFPDANGGGGGGGVVGRLCGWPSSRIVRVSRASGGKDRHSKVLTSKGLRDRRVRLSVTTAIQFYDLQDRLGYDQPSKAVEWLIKAASSSIAELPSLDPSFSGADGYNHHHHNNNQHQKQLSDEKKSIGNDNELEDPNYQDNNHQNHNSNNTNNVSLSKSSACSSTSETSKGSGLSLSRSENRVRARERARDMTSKKEKEKDGDSVRAAVLTQVNGIPHNSSFTDLLTGGITNTAFTPNNNPNPAANPESRMQWTTTPMDYFFNRQPHSYPQIIQMPQFNITTGDNPQQHHFSFLHENFAPVVTTTGSDGGGDGYNLNFSIASSSSGGSIAPGFSRGTLQSNLLSILPHHHHLQRFQPPSMADGSASTNFPFFIAPTIGSGAPDHFPATGYESQRRQLYGEAVDGGRHHSDHHKEKSKN